MTRSHGANPPTHLRLIPFIHVEEMGHRGMNRRPRPIIGRHIHDTAEHFQEACIPIFGDVMPRGAVNPVSMKALRSVRIASRSFQSATPRLQNASSVKQSKTFPKVLS
jgi:hypothetical protein